MFKVQKLNGTGKRFVTVAEKRGLNGAMFALSRFLFSDGTYRILHGRKTLVTRTYAAGQIS